MGKYLRHSIIYILCNISRYNFLDKNYNLNHKQISNDLIDSMMPLNEYTIRYTISFCFLCHCVVILSRLLTVEVDTVGWQHVYVRQGFYATKTRLVTHLGTSISRWCV